MIRALSTALSTHHPERLARMVVYPVPWLLRGLWSVVKGALDPMVAEKAVFLGASPAGCRYPPTLSEYVDLSTMPTDAMYGLFKPPSMAKFTRSTVARALSERSNRYSEQDDEDYSGTLKVDLRVEAGGGSPDLGRTSVASDEGWRAAESQRSLSGGKKRSSCFFGCFRKKDHDEEMY